MRLRPIIILISLVVLVGFIAFRIELALPGTPPSLYNTYTPLTKPTSQEIGSYDVLGHTIGKAEADQLLQTETGRQELSPENGAVEVTEELINLGRKAFYLETFGNEYLFTDVIGILDGPLNLASLSKAILALGGKPTTNLQITLDKDITVGDRTFSAGTVLNTGLDVPKGSLFPLGIRSFVDRGKVRVGVTCALCHATVSSETGRVLEGAPNNDVDTGLIIAFASNSAALFRQASANPTEMPPGDRIYINKDGQEARLPDIQAMEDAVDTDLLSWPPGNFTSNGDLKNNPSQIPSSYTQGSWPYSWSGVASVGWFHGLTTLNNAVFGVNADPATTADVGGELLGVDKEIYLGTMLQNASNPKFRLPNKVKPSEFFEKIDPTPGEPGFNEVIKMPEYPKGSVFMQNGLMAASPGYKVAEQINAMSAYQNTLAPPPYQPTNDIEVLKHGAAVFNKAGCVDCHSGRYFTNHDVIAQRELGTQPSRAQASKGFAKLFVPPQTYPPNVSVPLPPDPPVIPVPTDIMPQEDLDLAYAQSDPLGGFKVPNLIGLYLSAPYLHDGGVAASSEALKPDKKGFKVANPDQLGMAGTLLQGIQPDPSASLRVLVDRNLRKPVVAANRANPDLQRVNVDGSGHNYWVDRQAGFSVKDQTDLIQFLLSIDDDPEVLLDN
ncbi:di-heme oxidoredictase family protein [Chroococcidiopsis sp. TS-821]|uniref:di-heme oxidoredictase family protein n=1 Tax=Chroococcidiopsis sp. TS-821 TaxID=1378066 RepID=UPI000CEE38E4|nr:di-heme oxidoredictase family protein [Chroococcidiopsis sp. TS-821]PPS42286.1 hypothetical protein B1A85_14740 [Chroococcidiopsis sp. TS-821]